MLWMFFFFFFKQKTAYEMRISDWSSDVCSSDLKPGSLLDENPWSTLSENQHSPAMLRLASSVRATTKPSHAARLSSASSRNILKRDEASSPDHQLSSRPERRSRSEEPRVGNACVRTCRSRWASST